MEATNEEDLSTHRNLTLHFRMWSRAGDRLRETRSDRPGVPDRPVPVHQGRPVGAEPSGHLRRPPLRQGHRLRPVRELHGIQRVHRGIQRTLPPPQFHKL